MEQPQSDHLISIYKDLLTEYKEKLALADDQVGDCNRRAKQAEKQLSDCERELISSRHYAKQLEDRVSHSDGIAKTINALLKQTEGRLKESEIRLKESEERNKKITERAKAKEACLKETINCLKETEQKLKDSEKNNLIKKSADEMTEALSVEKIREAEKKTSTIKAKLDSTELYIIKLETQLKDTDTKLFQSEVNLKRATDRLSEHNVRVQAIEDHANKQLKIHDERMITLQNLLHERETVIQQLMDSLKDSQDEVERLTHLEQIIITKNDELKDMHLKLETLRRVNWSVGGNPEQAVYETVAELHEVQAQLQTLKTKLAAYEHKEWIAGENPTGMSIGEFGSMSNDDNQLYLSNGAENKEIIQKTTVYKQLERELSKVRAHLDQEKAWRMEAEDVAFSKTE